MMISTNTDELVRGGAKPKCQAEESNKKLLKIFAVLSPIATSIIMCFSAPFINEATQSMNRGALNEIYELMVVLHVIVIATLFIAKRGGNKDKIIGATMLGWFVALLVYTSIFPALLFTVSCT